MAPNMVVDDEVIGKATREVVLEKIKGALGGMKVESV
jgi:NADH:ubiquinone oxidoreductase subunit E